MPPAAPVTASDKTALAATLKIEAHRLGFDLVGIAPAVTPTGFHQFHEWLQHGYAGAMEYLPRREAAYEHPRHVLDRVRSVVMLGVNYQTELRTESRLAATRQRSAPSSDATITKVARYAQGSVDYHDLLRERLKALADWLHGQVPGCRTRGVVDTAPMLERDFARLAGLGWFGKNTMLINKRVGSYFFLAALLTDVELEFDQPHETSHCGTCTRCLEACPTEAFVEPYVLDARRCISYLTIELRQPIPTELRKGMGDWLFGCDVCQEVCPWNRKAPVTDEPAFQPVRDLTLVDAVALLRMTEQQFRERFRQSPLSRPKRAGLLRNAAIVLGNSGDVSAVPALIDALTDDEPLIRGAAAWALGELGGAAARTALQSRRDAETDPVVRNEIDAALEHCRSIV